VTTKGDRVDTNVRGTGLRRTEMSVILTGFMGTGKSTVGKQLAERLGVPFVDTDERIEQMEGRPIAAIFAADGEAYFREVERRVLAEALHGNAVVATGGGAITDPINRERMRAAGPIVCLTADVDVILERTERDARRPLLNAQERRTQVTQLLQERSRAYAQADFTVDTSRRTVDAILDDILSFLARRPTPRQGDPS